MAEFEEKCKEPERARAIFKYALDHIPKGQAQDVYKRFVQFEKQHGDREGIEVSLLAIAASSTFVLGSTVVSMCITWHISGISIMQATCILFWLLLLLQHCLQVHLATQRVCTMTQCTA